MERRSQATSYRSEGRNLIGYAAVWDAPTLIREGGRTFTELVRRSAFARSLKAGGDVLCCFNHSPHHLLGRTSSGTLKVTADDTGLRFDVELPDTITGNEVRELASRGDLRGASFAFSVPQGGDKWSGSTRELVDVTLVECGPVVAPAYQATSVGLRSAWNWYHAKLRLIENC